MISALQAGPKDGLWCSDGGGLGLSERVMVRQAALPIIAVDINAGVWLSPSN